MTAPYIRGILEAHAATRQRVTDEHMFTITSGTARMGTFRLQLFTAPGARPVAIATQTTGEGGSLTNRAEKYAAWSAATLTAGAARDTSPGHPSPRKSRPTTSHGSQGCPARKA